ncbi:MAG TPA: hypothetical protein VHZ26_13725 [Caulobacteraceae bacterium]|nr:hypothetical protein [Caulobacteraceae bacterium]
MGEKPGLSLLAMIIASAFAGAAGAADVCQGPAPAAGAAVHGPVLAVPDGSSLCLATGATPSAWVKIPLSRLRTSQRMLMAAAFGKNATCAIGADGRGECLVEGRPLAASLQSPEVVKAAYLWR